MSNRQNSTGLSAGFYEILRTDYPANAVLLIEAHVFASHAEFLPCYAKYFRSIGFKVDVLFRQEHLLLHPLTQEITNSMEGVRFFCVDFHNDYERSLLFELAVNYEFILLTTNDYSLLRFEDFYYNYVIQKKKNNFYAINHSETYRAAELKAMKDDADRVYYDRHVFNFGVMQKSGPFICPVSEIYPCGGAVKKNTQTRFLSIGALLRKNRDYDLLIYSMRDLIKDGVTNFHVEIIGAANEITLDDFRGLEPWITVAGSTSYPKMYDKIKKSDFFLFLSSYDKQNHYIDNNPSGIFNLGLMFGKPQLVQEEFAKAYGYDNENSLIYSEKNLTKSMNAAIDMDSSAYTLLVAGVHKMRGKIQNQSIEHIKKYMLHEEGLFDLHAQDFSKS
jgi:hypothetical protein